MAIEKTTMYFIVCDNCGHMNDCDSDGRSYIYDSIKEAEDWGDMTAINGKHYCSDCIEYDDNDNITIKTKKR